MNTNRTRQPMPPKVLEAIDHVRRFFPVVDMVIFNDAGRWQFTGEDFDKVVFGDADIDISLLEEASQAAFDVNGGYAVAFQAYTSEGE